MCSACANTHRGPKLLDSNQCSLSGVRRSSLSGDFATDRSLFIETQFRKLSTGQYLLSWECYSQSRPHGVILECGCSKLSPKRHEERTLRLKVEEFLKWRNYRKPMVSNPRHHRHSKPKFTETRELNSWCCRYLDTDHSDASDDVR